MDRAEIADTGPPLSLPAIGARQSLREQIADAIRAAVMAGQMRAGVLYSVPALTESFAVSATPVREAMLDLAKEGLFTPVRNKGFRVIELSDKDLDDITELRALIEVPPVARLAATIEAADIETLRPLAQAIVDGAAEGDLISYLEADRHFHLHLLGLTGNPRLVEVVGDLRAQTRLYGLGQLAEQGTLIASAAEHHELLDALAAHDEKRTEALMRRHIGHVRGIWAAHEEDDAG